MSYPKEFSRMIGVLKFKKSKCLAVTNLPEICKIPKVFYFKVSTSNNKSHLLSFF